jgi:Zn-dependent peptidase ImmA (M78 family)
MTDVTVPEARGFCLAEFPLPVIVANIKDAPRGRVFTLVHEVAHVALRQDGLCDLDDVTTRSRERLQVERFCNTVAGATLVPRDAILGLDVVRSHGTGPEWTDEALSALADRFGVSQEVILRRLLDLRRTSLEFYRERREQFLQEYETAREQREAGFAPPYQVAWASAGPAFTGLVLSSYSSGNITASDVSDYLGIRLKHLPRIEEQLLAGERRR